MTTSQLAQSPTFASPPWAEFLFRDPKSAWLWLVVRLYLGYDWLEHGLEKLSNPAWVQTGEALKGFWQRAVTRATCAPANCL